MKSLLKTTAQRFGGHLYSRGSLPTGVNWLLDIQRALAIDRDPLCFDVGANVGQTVTALRETFGGAHIHAFEPFSTPRALLVEATRADPRTTVVPLAMGSAPGSLLVQPHEESQMSSLATTTKHREGSDPECITIDTLDRYCASQQIDSIDILKTDTEGYDLEVLRGASELLAGQRIGYVYIEVTFMPNDRQHTAFAPVMDLLTIHGYRFLGLYETYPLHFFEDSSVYCNALFVSSAMRKRSLAARRTT